MDDVQAWDPHNRMARSFLNIISSNEASALGKTIIVAGGRDLQDPVWKKTTIKYRHNKDGLVTSETTTTFSLTGSMILLMVTIGGVTMALDAIDEIRDEVSFRGVISKIVWPF